MRKYILPMSSIIASCIVFAAGLVRQLGPDGSPLTLSIIFSSAVNIARGVEEIKKRHDEPDAIMPDITLDQIVIHRPTTHFRDMVSKNNNTELKR